MDFSEKLISSIKFECKYNFCSKSYHSDINIIEIKIIQCLLVYKTINQFFGIIF